MSHEGTTRIGDMHSHARVVRLQLFSANRRDMDFDSLAVF